MAVRLWDIAPVGEGLTGRGRNAPSPVFACRWKHPHRPAATAASSRPLQRGRASVWRLTRIPCPGRGTGFQQGVHTDGREVVSSRGTVSMENRPRGEGLTGRGRNAPSPVFACRWKPFSLDHPHRPAAAAASSRPLQRGRAVCGDSPDTVPGERETGFWQGVHVDDRVGMLSWAVYPWRIAAVGEGLTGRGRNAPSPVSACHRRPFSLDHPHRPAAIAPDSRAREENRDSGEFLA